MRYEEFRGPIGEYVDEAPLPEARKPLMVEVYERYRKEDYLAGDPTRIREVVRDFRYTTPEEYFRRELFPPSGPESGPRGPPGPG